MFLLGDLVTITNTVTDIDGIPVDPTEMTISVLEPDQTLTPFEIDDPLVSNPEIGTYIFTMPKAFDAPGVWRVRFQTFGDVQVAAERRLRVADSRFPVSSGP